MIEQYDDLSHSQPWLAGCSKEGCIGRQDRMIACDLQVYYPVWDMCLILQQLLLFLFLPLHLGTRCITLGSVHYPLSFYQLHIDVVRSFFKLTGLSQHRFTIKDENQEYKMSLTRLTSRCKGSKGNWAHCLFQFLKKSPTTFLVCWTVFFSTSPRRSRSLLTFLLKQNILQFLPDSASVLICPS